MFGRYAQDIVNQPEHIVVHTYRVGLQTVSYTHLTLPTKA